jgi:hypothetical protein
MQGLGLDETGNDALTLSYGFPPTKLQLTETHQKQSLKRNKTIRRLIGIVYVLGLEMELIFCSTSTLSESFENRVLETGSSSEQQYLIQWRKQAYALMCSPYRWLVGYQ